MALGHARGRAGSDAGVRRQRQWWWRRNASDRTIGRRSGPERRNDHHRRQRGQPEHSDDLDRAKRHLREQQWQHSRDGLGSTPPAYGLSRNQRRWDHRERADEAHERTQHGSYLRVPRSHSRHQRQSEGDDNDSIDRSSRWLHNATKGSVLADSLASAARSVDCGCREERQIGREETAITWRMPCLSVGIPSWKLSLRVAA